MDLFTTNENWSSTRFVQSFALVSYTLRVSFIGYHAKSVPVTAATTGTEAVDVSLEESASSLNEVVVIGSWSQTARTNGQTAAPVDVISTKELKDQIYIDPRNALGSVDYASGRDNSNRGCFLYQPSQGGYNGRYVFGRINVAF